MVARLEPTTTTLICPRNDGEGVAIIELAKCLGFDVRESNQPWGATLEEEPAMTFADLKENVVIVEMPGVAKEKELGERHKLYIIDHHKYESIDRGNPRSSLEQLAELAGYTLNRWQTGVALNDRGYIPALQQHQYSREEIRQIREFDLRAQGYIDTDFRRLEAEYELGQTRDNQLYVVQTSQPKTSYLADVHFWKNTERTQKLDLLILSTSNNAQVKKVSFTGRPAVARRLFEKLGGFCGGDECASMYWGKELPETPQLDELLKHVDEAVERKEGG
ncbi:MAG: hypothetical protein QME66_11885 [Candidatus Eisenbacteria bacterium]|nr:hypothetical protein [Candidatus Eisenbacteria bacterium]